MALDRFGWSTSRPGRFTPRERDSVPIVQVAVWNPAPFWTGMENLALSGFEQGPFNQYQLSYPGYWGV